MIPIYRAKKVDSDEYIIGYLLPEFKGKFYLSTEWSKDIDGNTPNFVQVDISTLSIHFSEMLDSQGNKIFASLQEDGKGGDIIETELKRVCTVKYKEYFFYANNKDYHCNCFGFIHSKIIGIQQ